LGLATFETDGRCAWANPKEPIYVAYHDEEWGVPEYDPRALWEKLVLDGFQAGLSWITILKKRAAFRAAFAGFDPEIVAGFGEADRARLMADAGIIRSNAKIDAAIAGTSSAAGRCRIAGAPSARFRRRRRRRSRWPRR
jgi:DNA-3-methyladenine glycosylase I